MDYVYGLSSPASRVKAHWPAVHPQTMPVSRASEVAEGHFP